MHWSPMSWFTSKALQVRCGTSAHSPGHPRPLPPLRRSPPGLPRLSTIHGWMEGPFCHSRAGSQAVGAPDPFALPARPPLCRPLRRQPAADVMLPRTAGLRGAEPRRVCGVSGRGGVAFLQFRVGSVVLVRGGRLGGQLVCAPSGSVWSSRGDCLGVGVGEPWGGCGVSAGAGVGGVADGGGARGGCRRAAETAAANPSAGIGDSRYLAILLGLGLSVRHSWFRSSWFGSRIASSATASGLRRSASLWILDSDLASRYGAPDIPHYTSPAYVSTSCI